MGNIIGLLQNLAGGNEEKDDKPKKPIIFIPGITGSELYSIDPKYVTSFEREVGMISKEKEQYAKRLWLPLDIDAEDLNNDLNIKNEVYGLDEGDFRFSKILERNPGPADANAILLNALLLKCQDRPVYQFSYDWRKTNTISSKKLEAFIKSINNDGKVKVDIVAHSMGGIVSAHYLLEHDTSVDKFVSLCTPYEGAPHAYNQMTSGAIFGGFKDIVLEKFFGIDKEVIYDYDGLVELYPTTKMLMAYPYQRVKDQESFDKIVSTKHKTYEDILSELHEASASEDVKYSAVQKEIRSYLGLMRYEKFSMKARRYRERNSMLESVKLLDRPRSMFIVGKGTETQVSGYFTKDDAGKTIANEFTTKEGDGLVPMFSASMGLRLDEMPKEYRRKFKFIRSTHQGMLVNLRAINAMCKFLNED